MILRRITQHLKQQHWTGVFIELVIVILGVFIGLQVSNWNQARQDNQRRVEAISLLQDEAMENVKALRALMKINEETIAGDSIVARAVATGKLAEQDRPVFEKALSRFEYSSTLPVRNSAYRALEQSGDLALIHDRTLLVALSEFQSQVNWVDGQNRYFRMGYNSFAPYWRPHVWHHRDPDSGKRYITYDLGALSADKQAASAVTEVDRMHAIQAGYIRKTLDQAVRLCQSLSARSGRRCGVTGTSRQ